MSIIRTAFVTTTSGTLAAIASTVDVVQVNAEALKQVSRVGLINATGWAEAAEEDRIDSKEERRLVRAEDRNARLTALAISMAKRQEQLSGNPAAMAIFAELTGKTKLRVAAE